MSDNGRKGLTVVVPVYNERGAVHDSIQRMKQICDSFRDEIEVIFVDDGSTDGSEEVLGDTSQNPFRVIRNPTNIDVSSLNTCM